jgi:hypothetical protein
MFYALVALHMPSMQSFNHALSLFREMHIVFKLLILILWAGLGAWVLWGSKMLPRQEGGEGEKSTDTYSVYAPGGNVHIGNVYNPHPTNAAVFPKALPLSTNEPQVEVYTLSLIRRVGATISLGDCPGKQCVQFVLGDIVRGDNGELIQELTVRGVVKSRAANTSKYLVEIDFPFRAQGAALSVPLDGSDPVIRFSLTPETNFELFGEIGDFKFTLLDANVSSLKLKLEVKPPSGFRLGKK